MRGVKQSCKTSSDQTIPIILCIDVEPDERQINCENLKDWEGFPETCQVLSALRPTLAAATGAPAHFSWFLRMDPQIERVYGSSDWVTKRYADIIAQLEKAGDELGLHTHAWRWDETLRRWIADYGDQEWINQCLRLSFDEYQNVFGRTCASFRFGDHWMNDDTMEFLEALGTQFDLTIEPGRTVTNWRSPVEAFTGSFADYVSVPRRPYKPSRQDFRIEGREAERKLWAIPLSTGKEPGRYTGVKRIAGALGIDLRKHNDTVPLNLSLDTSIFSALLESWLSMSGEDYLALVVRTDACLPSPSKANVARNLNFLLAHPLARRFTFSTPAEAMALLT